MRCEVSRPRPATSSSPLPPVPSPPRAHSRVSLAPPSLAPARRGVSAARGGEGSNQSQAGNSSRGARPGSGRWGAGSEPRGPPRRPSSCEPAPASWKLGRQPTPLLRSTFLPLGWAGHERWAAPFRPVRWERRGPQHPPPDLGQAPPPHSRLDRASSGRFGGWAATLGLIHSALGAWLIPITRPSLFTERLWGYPGLCPLLCATPSTLDLRLSASCEAATIMPILQVKAVRLRGARLGESGGAGTRTAASGKLPGPCWALSGLSVTDASPLQAPGMRAPRGGGGRAEFESSVCTFRARGSTQVRRRRPPRSLRTTQAEDSGARILSHQMCTQHLPATLSPELLPLTEVGSGGVQVRLSPGLPGGGAGRHWAGPGAGRGQDSVETRAVQLAAPRGLRPRRGGAR